MPLFLLIIYTYLFLAVLYYGNKRKQYNHYRFSISELGETNSIYQTQVAYLVFLPVGLAAILFSYLTFSYNQPVAMLLGCVGVSYFLSAFFPCDAGTPFLGSWKNTIHNIAGGICYAGMAYQLNELIDLNIGWYIDVSLFLLCAFLLMFIIGFPKSFIGLAQRIAETSIFVSAFFLLG